MRVPRYLRDRWLPTTIIGVALAAGLSQLLLWWMGPPPKANDFVGPPRSGYTLTNFKLWSYDTDGLPAFRMQSPHLERREGDESLYINAPKFELPSNAANVPDWQGESLYSWVDKSGTLIKLQGPVYLHRPAFGDTAAAAMHTADATVWPKENRLTTAAPAQIVQGATTLHGVGLRANLNQNHLELLDESHGTFPPRKRKS